jgi:hypothetical protein
LPDVRFCPTATFCRTIGVGEFYRESWRTKCRVFRQLLPLYVTAHRLLLSKKAMLRARQARQLCGTAGARVGASARSKSIHSGSNMMKAMIQMMAAFAVLVTLGCSEATTRKDVASARDKLQEEKQETADTIREGQRDVAEAQREHTVARPVTPDTRSDAQREVADAKQDAAERIAKQKEEERAAAGQLADTEQAFKNTQARDAYVKEVEQKLADTDTQIDGLKERASKTEGADKDALNRQIDMMKTQRDLAEKALKDLKSAELANWKNHQEHVRLALQDLDNSVRNIR